MDRNVTLRISGLHMESGQGDDGIETVTPAEYFCRGEAHYVLYEENQEDLGEGIKSRIKFKNGVLELIRQGMIETHMIFEEGKHHNACYVLPYGKMTLGIDTKKLVFEKAQDSIRIEVEYVLEIDGQHQADSRIRICIKES